ncbi:hypothetical protein PHYBOEH_006480 [Phytophthora boehmeriae]|uniref:Uncharacterized protein n=1 Tax=Phytophthora boehmeriae TaxID=109152 RepID=A0A8T1WG20_9STRA|nr:hypothetical protein PHYBOEH_006480 [Phytophthora boehmeriae]
MAALPVRSRSGSTGSKPRRSLPLLLGLVVVLALGALCFELSFVAPEGQDPEEYQDVLHVLDAAAAAEDGDQAPPTGGDEVGAFYPDAVFDTDWSKRIAASDILHESALHRGCVKHKNSVLPWTFGAKGQSEEDNLSQLVNQSDGQLLDKLRQCPDVDVFLPEGLRSFGYCEDAAAYTKFEDVAAVGDGSDVRR